MNQALETDLRNKLTRANELTVEINAKEARVKELQEAICCTKRESANWNFSLGRFSYQFAPEESITILEGMVNELKEELISLRKQYHEL